jgi:hypothetical protein
MKYRITTLMLLSLALMGCRKTESYTYELRSYGTWTVGEARTCLFAKGVDHAPCFTPGQIQNGTQEPQRGYLVSVTLDRDMPPGDVFGLVCRLDSDSHASCHVPSN